MTGPRVVVDVTHAPVRGPGDVGLYFRPAMGRQAPPGGTVVYQSSGASWIQMIFSGPWADGRLMALKSQMIEAAKYAVAAQGLADVMFNLNASIQHPTPYYETQIQIERQVNDIVVNDHGVVYGPWLEGVSSRNRTTRFKGYASFRRAADGLRNKVGALLGVVLDQYLPKMNGGI